MLGRMIFRLSLKALLPLAAVAGMASYAQYMAGGDPFALWNRVGGGALARLGSALGGAGEGVRAPLDALGELGGENGRAAPTRLWTWRDAEGVAQFGDHPPAGVRARPMTIDPNVNVVAPPPARTVVSAGGDAGAAAAGQGAPPGTPLPGIAGALGARHGDAAPDEATSAAALRELLVPRGR